MLNLTIRLIDSDRQMRRSNTNVIDTGFRGLNRLEPIVRSHVTRKMSTIHKAPGLQSHLPLPPSSNLNNSSGVDSGRSCGIWSPSHGRKSQGAVASEQMAGETPSKMQYSSCMASSSLLRVALTERSLQTRLIGAAFFRDAN